MQEPHFCAGYVFCLDRGRSADSGGRIRRANAALFECRCTCTVIYRWRAIRPPPRVQWDAARRVLYVGKNVVKQYRVPSPTQEAVLNAFEEEGWPARIDDPLRPDPDQDVKRHLHDTIRRLNRNRRAALIHFSGDGTGEGVLWELTAARRLAVGRRRAA